MISRHQSIFCNLNELHVKNYIHDDVIKKLKALGLFCYHWEYCEVHPKGITNISAVAYEIYWEQPLFKARHYAQINRLL